MNFSCTFLCVCVCTCLMAFMCARVHIDPIKVLFVCSMWKRSPLCKGTQGWRSPSSSFFDLKKLWRRVCLSGTACPRYNGGSTCGPCWKCWPSTRPASANTSRERSNTWPGALSASTRASRFSPTALGTFLKQEGKKQNKPNPTPSVTFPHACLRTVRFWSWSVLATGLKRVYQDLLTAVIFYEWGIQNK